MVITASSDTASSSSTALALSSPVAEIKRLGQDLSKADCQTLAVYFAVKYASQVIVHTPNAKMLAAKLAVVPVCLEPAADWEWLLGEHAARSANPRD